MMTIERNRFVRVVIALVALLVIVLIAAIVLLPDVLARIVQIFLR